jgi:hypothetical protein
MPRELTYEERLQRSKERSARSVPCDTTGRCHTSIDPGMAAFIIAMTGCAPSEVPAKLQEWMATKARGSGTI